MTVTCDQLCNLCILSTIIRKSSYRMAPITKVWRTVGCLRSGPDIAPCRASWDRVPEGEGTEHQTFLPLFQQLQLTQTGQTRLKALLIPTALSCHWERKRSVHRSPCSLTLLRSFLSGSFLFSIQVWLNVLHILFNFKVTSVFDIHV